MIDSTSVGPNLSMVYQSKTNFGKLDFVKGSIDWEKMKILLNILRWKWSSMWKRKFSFTTQYASVVALLLYYLGVASWSAIEGFKWLTLCLNFWGFALSASLIQSIPTFHMFDEAIATWYMESDKLLHYLSKVWYCSSSSRYEGQSSSKVILVASAAQNLAPSYVTQSLSNLQYKHVSLNKDTNKLLWKWLSMMK